MAGQSSEATPFEAGTPAPTVAAGPPPELVRKIASGSSWLWAIAALSALTFAAEVSHWGFRMLVGMGAPVVAAVLAERAGVGSALLFGLVSAVLILGFFALAWLAGTGKRWAYMVAGVIYLLDGLLLAVLQDWLSVAFHGIALFFVFQAWYALGKTGPIAVRPAVLPANGVAAQIGAADLPSGSRLLKVAAIAGGGFLLIIALIFCSALLIARP